MKTLTPYALPKSLRVSLRRDIDLLFTDSEALLVYPVRCTFRRSEHGATPRVMVVAPKRNHKHAVVRNLLKRRMREAFRLNRHEIVEVGGGLDISLSYIAKEVTDYEVIEKAVRKILKQICQRTTA